MSDESNQPERPRTEPEIIPPDRTARSEWDRPAWTMYDPTSTRGTHRIYVTRIGPVGAAILMLVFAVLVAVLLLAIIGTALLWIPAVALAAAIAAVFNHRRR
jgi:hypothetical protein